MPRATVTIRRAGAGDAELLTALGAKTFADSFGPDNTAEDMATYMASAFNPQRQADELADPASVTLIAEVDRVAAGYARLRQGRGPDGVVGDHPLELVRIYAEAAWIGHGVGAALMQACLDQALALGCDTLWLGVWEHNPHAIAFYRRWGFQQVGTKGFVLGSSQQTDIVMQRPVRLTAAAADRES